MPPGISALRQPSGIVSLSVGSNDNNFNPPGLHNAGLLKLNPTSQYSLTGLAGGWDGRLLMIANVGTAANYIELIWGSTLSLAQNRFGPFTSNTDTYIVPGQMVLLRYDGGLRCWLVVNGASRASNAQFGTIANLATSVNLTIQTTGSLSTGRIIIDASANSTTAIEIKASHASGGVSLATGSAGALSFSIAGATGTKGQVIKHNGTSMVFATDGLAIYGDGSDGALTYDGSTTILGMAPAANVYTLTRDIYATDLTVNNGVSIVGGYRIFCTGTLTNNGTIRNNGGNASGTTAGTAAARGAWPASGAGAAGTASGTTTVVGTAAAASGSTTVLLTVGAAGGSGGNSNPGAGGTLNTVSANVLNVRDASTAIQGITSTSGSSSTTGPTLVGLCGGSGGGAGGRTTGGTATASGAGGGGAGIVMIAARIIDNTNGTISANGGNGSNATGGTCVTGGGGGGGGGGVLLVYDYLVAGIETATGGTKGTGLNGGAAAVDGTVGKVIKIPNAA